jgi:hypothetical protein
MLVKRRRMDEYQVSLGQFFVRRQVRRKPRDHFPASLQAETALRIQRSFASPPFFVQSVRHLQYGVLRVVWCSRMA